MEPLTGVSYVLFCYRDEHKGRIDILSLNGNFGLHSQLTWTTKASDPDRKYAYTI